MRVKPQTGYPEKIRLGSRGSPLALVQAEMVKAEITRIAPSVSVDIHVIKTSGDWKPEQGETYLSEAEGGKALFAKELEAALLNNEIDIAVHSMKDMETQQPEGLYIPFMLPREDVRDVYLSNISQNLTDLPVGSIVGTCSIRRAAFVLKRRPDVKIVPLRGNVQTRINKLAGGQVDATLLAYAGLKRLGLAHEVKFILPVEEMVPAAGQGAVGIEIRKSDKDELSFFSQFSCEKTNLCVSAERAALHALGGSCRTPVGVHVMLENGKMHIISSLLVEDGSGSVEYQKDAIVQSLEQACALGRDVGLYLKANAPKGALSCD